MAEKSKTENSDYKGDRIAKVMARAGLCSRREAERWIEAGRVKVNGTVIDSAALNVTTADKIEIDGKPLPQKEPPRLFLYHKPVGLVTTHSDDQGRKTVFDDLPDDLPRVISIGRLDLNSEGLLLLTNDGELSRYLELPSTGWARQYRVRAFGEIGQKKLTALSDGITVEGIHYGPITATLEKSDGRNSWINMTLREGKNREIRNVLRHLGLQVNRLIRISYGPFHLGKIPVGTVEEVRPSVLKAHLPKEILEGQE